MTDLPPSDSVESSRDAAELLYALVRHGYLLPDRLPKDLGVRLEVVLHDRYARRSTETLREAAS